MASEAVWRAWFNLDGNISAGEALYAAENGKQNLPLPTLNEQDRARYEQTSLAAVYKMETDERAAGGGGGTGGGSTGNPLTDSLTGNQRNAFQALSVLFDDYGLSTLAPKILEYIKQGYDANTVEILLRETAEYKQRFAANEARKNAGKSTLSPAEYIAMERQYAQVLRANGMPAGFYDSTDDFRNWIAGDVSVNEVQQRVAAARRAVFDAPPETRQALYDYYGVGVSELTAYFLDEKRALPLLERELRTAEVAGAAKRAGFELSEKWATGLTKQGVTAEQALAGYQQIAETMPDAKRLSDIYGKSEGRYDVREAEREAFSLNGAADATAKRKRLASRERAEFGGSSGVRRGSLSQDTTAL